MNVPGAACIRPVWAAPAGVGAVMTVRRGAGCSAPPYDQFNLATHTGDDPARVSANRAELRSLLALPDDPVWLHQVHGTTVADLARIAPGTVPEADAAVSREPGRVCALLTADCLPVLLCDRQGTVVAAAHAGWRGLAAGILERTVEAMAVEPADVLVWLGAAISPSAFEVGPEVRDAFTTNLPNAAEAFTPGQGDRWHGDLQCLARQRLAAAGIAREHVWTLDACTCGAPEQWFSYRRDGVTGRMAALVWLR